VHNGPSAQLQTRNISESVALLSGFSLAVAVHLAYNVAVDHLGFGNANALYALLTLTSAIALFLQIVSSKFIAQQSDQAIRVGLPVNGSFAPVRYKHISINL